MTKYIATDTEGFGERLALLRKATGYTQEQLAAELGISRRRIAYYEAESDHPPVGFLTDLARVLNTTTDALLGQQDGARNGKLSLSPRLERRLKQIERLSPKPTQQLISIIDSFIAAEQLRGNGRAP
ncbi:MAG TPA: helix-turn-helix transcriptional regulator [Polyangiaceae bacterium]